MNKKAVFFLAVLFVLASCTPFRVFDADSDFVIDEKNQKGVVVISITRSSTFDAPFNLSFRPMTGSLNWMKAGVISILGNDDWDDVPAKNSSEDYDKFSGRLVVFEVKPGNYEFSDLSIEDDYEQGRWASGGNYSIPFDVEAGRVTYIGNVHVQYTNLGNNAFIIKSESRFNNRSKRDLELFSEKFSSVGKDNIRLSKYIGDNESLESFVRTHLGVEAKKRD